MRPGFLAILFVLLTATAASATPAFFHSPTGNIECQLQKKLVYCESLAAQRTVTMKKDGTLKLCATACLSDGPEDAITLAYGKSIKRGSIKCSSAQDGITCRTHGKGFRIDKSGVHDA
jgi:hypothetical protein